MARSGLVPGKPIEITPQLVELVLERVFTAPDRAAARALLERYGRSPDHPEPVRVHVALLKLSEGQVELLAHFVERAQRDYRDVLAWAEYPEQLVQPTWSMPPEEVRKITHADRAQYVEWLRKYGED